MTVRCSDPHASGLDIRASPAKRLHQTVGPDGKWGERRDGFGFLARALNAGHESRRRNPEAGSSALSLRLQGDGESNQTGSGIGTTCATCRH